ncbi:MAG: sorbosone dehydrogenase, partial [Candidatus Melainabacteria bacterium HGW-Melainabacteria-1]
SDGDGRAEQTQYFGDSDCGTGLAIDAQHLYYANDEEIWRMPLGPELLPNSPPERIAFALGKPAQHNARSLALDGAGHVYVNIGAPSNACQQQDRTPGSPGQDPCPLLSEFAGIWRFDINQRDQRKTPALRYASGIRNAVALDWHRDRLYLLQHGRDQLDTMFPDRFTAAQNTELPAEEFVALRQGEDLGWPYCYFDPAKSRKVLMPEYGGNGESVGRCGNFVTPLIGFPAHYAPNDLIFYSGNQFPAEYRDGAFIAFHGSWNRGGQQAGYHVVFVPFSGDKAGQWRVFANGFAGTEPIRSSGQARYRPMGLAQLPDGSLLVVDSKTGRIWKISHQGR